MFFFILIKSNKQVDMTNSFNKWVVLWLRNLDPFNKHVGLVSTYIVGYSRVDMTQIATPNIDSILIFNFSQPYLFFSLTHRLFI